MKLLFFIATLLSFGSNDIAKINELKTEAQKAYATGNYQEALDIYDLLTDSLNVSSDELLLNKAHAYYHLNDTSNAKYTYQKLVDIDNKKVQSVANQQLGVIADQPGNSKLALNYFKEAIKADPSNEEAKYNYEVLKKKIKEQEKNKDQNQDQKDQQDQKEDQENKDEEKEQESKEGDKKEGDQEEKENEENKEGEEQKEENKDQGEEQKDGDKGEEEEKEDGEEKEKDPKEGEAKDGEEKEGEAKDKEEEGKESKEPKSTEQKLKELNISPQQAKMILEAMKNQEVQYLQQQRRKPTKKKKSGKPDW